MREPVSRRDCRSAAQAASRRAQADADRDGYLAPPPTPGHEPQSSAEGAVSRVVAPHREPGPFDWLEGATGVRLDLAIVDRLLTLTVEGQLDRASLGVVESTLLEALDHSPARVEFDLRAASSCGDEMVVIVGRARSRARAGHVPLLLNLPRDNDRVVRKRPPTRF
jgi:hypothetical protein